jgi:hypothetical protein
MPAKLIGSRQEVWNGTARRTSGCLTKADLHHRVRDGKLVPIALNIRKRRLGIPVKERVRKAPVGVRRVRSPAKRNAGVRDLLAERGRLAQVRKKDDFQRERGRLAVERKRVKLLAERGRTGAQRRRPSPPRAPVRSLISVPTPPRPRRNKVRSLISVPTPPKPKPKPKKRKIAPISIPQDKGQAFLDREFGASPQFENEPPGQGQFGPNTLRPKAKPKPKKRSKSIEQEVAAFKAQQRKLKPQSLSTLQKILGKKKKRSNISAQIRAARALINRLPKKK